MVAPADTTSGGPMKLRSVHISALALAIFTCGFMTLWSCDDTGPSPVGVHAVEDASDTPTTSDDAGSDAGEETDGSTEETDGGEDAGDAGQDASAPTDAGDAGDAGDAAAI